MERLQSTINRVIAQQIPEGARVLDLGCGDGSLLEYLIEHKGVVGHGIEISTSAIVKCIEKGIPVIHWDLDKLPLDFPDNSYDYVILNQTIQQVLYTQELIKEILRVGKRCILGFPNFGNLGIRFSFFLGGRMPVTRELPEKWYNTPNIRVLTVKDFNQYCKENKIKIRRRSFLRRRHSSSEYKEVHLLTNARSDLAVYTLENRV